MLMEYPLRTLVFVAQVSVGIWRRNGYAVLHQVGLVTERFNSRKANKINQNNFNRNRPLFCMLNDLTGYRVLALCCRRLE